MQKSMGIKLFSENVHHFSKLIHNDYVHVVKFLPPAQKGSNITVFSEHFRRAYMCRLSNKSFCGEVQKLS